MRTIVLGLLLSALSAGTSCTDSNPTTPRDEPAGAPAAPRVPTDGLPAFGAAHPLVTVVAFVDYECPYCAAANDTLATLRTDYKEHLRVVVASRPLPMHVHARDAALAALAADEQGRFAAMHERLFAARSLDEDGIVEAARGAGLDLAKWNLARHGATAQVALARAEALAKTLDVTGTPTFFVDGQRIDGAQPLTTFKERIDADLVKARGLLATGMPRERIYAQLVQDAPKQPVDAIVPDVVHRVRTEGSPARGPESAPVTIAVFTDFECPFCAKLDGRLRELEGLYPGRLRLVYKARPLPMHPHARLAAKAAVAAHAQGGFWPFYDRLFAHKNALDRASLEAYAADAGLDVSRFARDLDDPRTAAALSADADDADTLGVTGTPTLFVNGRRLNGARSMPELVAAVDRALSEAR